MRGIWNRLRNAKTRWSAYRNVNMLTGDDLASDQMFTSLREFASSPSEPEAIPVGLLREFNAAQKRAKSRKKFRYGSGALFATIVLFPGLAYAGVLPAPVAQVVQRIFDVVSVPIHIPSVTSHTANSGQSSSDSTASDQPTSGTKAPSPEPTQTSDPTASSDTSATPTSDSQSTGISTQSTIHTSSGVSSTTGPSDEGELSGIMSENGGTSVDGAVATDTPTQTLDPSASPTETTAPDPSASPTETTDPQLVVTPDPSASPTDGSE